MKTVAVAVFAVVVLLATSSGALICYSCEGVSGEPAGMTTTSNCGRPFKDDGVAGGKIQNVTCEGVCVTQTHYNGGIATTIIRSCSDIPITDGCERAVGTDSKIYWTCIKSCKADGCNNDSGATSNLPPQLTLLVLLSALAPFISSFAQQ